MTTPAAEKTRVLTKYRVLKFPEPQNTANASSSFQQGFRDVGGTEAANANAAIRTVAEKAGAGKYVAIPESSWKPVEVTIEQQTVVKLSP